MSSPEPVWPVPMRAIGAQNLLTMPGGVTKSGYLHKKGGSQFSLLKWPLRYIIIHKGCVYYFKSSTSAVPQGAFSLNGYNRVMRAAEETTSSNVFPFKIVHFSKKHRTWFFSAASEEERRNWMRQLRREIDRYNDRQESHSNSSDTDSDADSFYGTIEKLMVINHPIDNTDDDYMEEDEDEDEEDYLKPDSDCSPTNTGRPTAPPPSYPPPPVPSSVSSNQLRVDSKGPPLPPPVSRIPTSPLPKKPPPTLPPPSSHTAPPPATPSAPHLQRPVHFSPSTPPLPPPNPRRPIPRAPSVDTRPAVPRLPSHPPSSVSRNGPARSPSPGNISKAPPLSKPAPPLSIAKSAPPLSIPKPAPPLSIPKPKLPPPTCKPPLPLSKKPTTASPLQRASPDGQSFRSTSDEVPAEIRWNSTKTNGEGSDDDDDYENVQLPDSVFIDTTETSFVEKLFKESSDYPEDGLYAIRNSGTKTSKVLVVWDISLNKARNYRLFEENGCIYLDCTVTFPSLAILIEHYYSHPLPQHGSLCLQKPYSKII